MDDGVKGFLIGAGVMLLIWWYCQSVYNKYHGRYHENIRSTFNEVQEQILEMAKNKSKYNYEDFEKELEKLNEAITGENEAEE